MESLCGKKLIGEADENGHVNIYEIHYFMVMRELRKPIGRCYLKEGDFIVHKDKQMYIYSFNENFTGVYHSDDRNYLNELLGMGFVMTVTESYFKREERLFEQNIKKTDSAENTIQAMTFAAILMMLGYLFYIFGIFLFDCFAIGILSIPGTLIALGIFIALTVIIKKN